MKKLLFIILLASLSYGQDFKTRDSVVQTRADINEVRQIQTGILIQILNTLSNLSNRIEVLETNSLNKGNITSISDGTILGYFSEPSDPLSGLENAPKSLNIDYVLPLSTLWNNSQASISTIIDSLNALSSFVYSSGGVTPTAPVYTFNYSPTLYFGDTKEVGQDSSKIVYIKNTGTATLKVTSLTYELVGGEDAVFTHTLKNHTSGANQDTVSVGDSVKLTITYTPTANSIGALDEWNLVITSNGGGNDTLFLSGVGAETAIPDVPSMIVYMPADLTTSSSGDSLGSLIELQAMIDGGRILPGASIRFERGGRWTVRSGKYNWLINRYVGLDVSPLEGTADDYITFETYGTGAKPIFDFSGTADMFTLTNRTESSGTYYSAKYLIFDNLSFSPSGLIETDRPRWAFYGEGGSDTIKYIEVNNCIINGTRGGFYINTGAVVHNISFNRDTIKNTYGAKYKTDGTLTGYGDGSGVGINVRRYAGYGYVDTVTVDSCVFIDIGGYTMNGYDPGGHEHGMYFGSSARDYVLTNNVFKNITNSSSYGDGINIAGGKKIWISDNQFSNMKSGITITPAQSNSGRIDSVYAYNNTFTTMTYRGIGIAGGGRTYTNQLVNELKIYNNLFYDFSGGHGIRSEQYDSLSNLLIANNTFVNLGVGSGFYHIYSDPKYVSNNRMMNNIFAQTAGADSALIRFYQSDGISDVFSTLNYNLYYRGTGTNYLEIEGTTYTSLASFVSATVYEDNGVSSNPNFVNVSADNYKLTASSPLNNGFNLFSSGVTTDFEGESRPNGAAFEMGFDEY